MARGSRGRRRIASRQFRSTPYPLPAYKRDACEEFCPKKCSIAMNTNDWEDVTCSVCMEYPHNAVLLLCSSHDKGCRPYMCGTSLRHSNCLDQYKKAYTKVISPNSEQPLQGMISNPSMVPNSILSLEKSEISELACPLCRGQVKGWTVVEHAREYLNAKKRSCMQDNCSYVGNYKELKKHVRAEHPSARPRAVDPAHEQKWQWLQWEREREDVISTITSTMPGAMVFGDYVIEGNHNELDSDDEEEGAPIADASAERTGRFHMDLGAMNLFLLLHAVGQGNELNLGRRLRPELASHRTTSQTGVDFSDQEDDNDGYSEGDGDGNGLSLVNRLRGHVSGGVLLGRSGRRRRRREAQAGGRM